MHTIKILGENLIVPRSSILRVMQGNTGRVILEVDGLYHPAYSDHRKPDDPLHPRSMMAFAAVAATECHFFQSDKHRVDQGTCRPRCPGCREDKIMREQMLSWQLIFTNSAQLAAKAEREGS